MSNRERLERLRQEVEKIKAELSEAGRKLCARSIEEPHLSIAVTRLGEALAQIDWMIEELDVEGDHGR